MELPGIYENPEWKVALDKSTALINAGNAQLQAGALNPRGKE